MYTLNVNGRKQNTYVKYLSLQQYLISRRQHDFIYCTD